MYQLCFNKNVQMSTPVISFSDMASRPLDVEVSLSAPTCTVITAPRVKVVNSNFCEASSCKNDKFVGEKMCFECISRVSKRCPNFSDCGGYNITGTNMCKKCSSKCTTCGGRTQFNKVTKRYNDVCNDCTRDVNSRCINFDSCEGRTRFNYDSKIRFDQCSKCHRDLISQCDNFATCGGRRFFSTSLDAYSDTCRKCYKAASAKTREPKKFE